MELTRMLLTATLLAVSWPVSSAQTIETLLTPAPAPSPTFVNLTDLLSVTGPFHTFLKYLIQTQVMNTFQNQANNTMQGITIFVPKDAAFSNLKKPSLSNITEEQLKTLLLYHALPRYYSFSDFNGLSEANPVSTFAGGQNTVNVTDDSGLIRVNSGWSNPKISSSVHSTYPVAVYQIDSVLIPEAIFGVPPPLPPAPAPSPDLTPPSDLAPALQGLAPKSSEHSNSDSSSNVVSIGAFDHLIPGIAAVLMMLLL